VLDRVDVDVIQVPPEVLVIADRVLPAPLLPASLPAVSVVGPCGWDGFFRSGWPDRGILKAVIAVGAVGAWALARSQGCPLRDPPGEASGRVARADMDCRRGVRSPWQR